MTTSPDPEHPPPSPIQQPVASRETLTLERPDPEEVTPFSPPGPAASGLVTRSPIPANYSRRGPKRKKMDKRRANLEKAWQKKLDALSKSLNPVPFVPGMTFDLASHEALLRRVGLWDFVHIEFDTVLRADLIEQLIATFSKDSRASYVNGVRIKVSRAELGRALMLPRRDKGGGESLSEIKGSKEEVGFMEKLVMNWLLLHDDMWIMPAEVLNWMGLIKDGSFERVDWASLMWFMVEKELLGKSDFELLGKSDFVNCYYASHLQCLIKHQKRELLKGDAVKIEVDAEEDEEVRVCEEVSAGVGMEECSIGLSLGGLNDAVRDEDKGETLVEGNLMNNVDKEHVIFEYSVAKEDKEGELPVEESVEKDDVKEELSNEENVAKDEAKEDIVIGHHVSDFQDCKEVEKFERVITASMDGCITGRCNQIGDEGIEFVEDMKRGKDFGGEEEMKEIEDDGEEKEQEQEQEEGEEEDEEEEQEEEEENGEHEDELDEEDFSVTPRRQDFECLASENLISDMEAEQHPFTSELQMHNVSGQFLMSNIGAQRVPGSSSLFGNCNENKRDNEHLENDFPHHSHGGSNKRIRNDGPWETNISSDMDICMDQMQHLMEKCKMMYNAKEQAYQEMSMSQQLCLEELQQRENVILHLKEDAQKKQLENYKLERELYMMSNLLDGYRKALKGTQKAFADYRAKYQLSQEPLYKDAGTGGLVLSKMELEKQQVKREEEEKQTLLILKNKILDFEAGLASGFGAYINGVNLLSDKLSSLEKKASLLREKSARRMIIDMPESALTVEGCMTIDMPESPLTVEGCITTDIPESAPTMEAGMTLDMPEPAPNVQG